MILLNTRKYVLFVYPEPFGPTNGNMTICRLLKTRYYNNDNVFVECVTVLLPLTHKLLH